MPCGGPKKSPRTSSIVQIILISEVILRSQKIINGLDSFSNQSLIYLATLDYKSLFIDYPFLKVAKLQLCSLAPFCQI